MSRSIGTPGALQSSLTNQVRDSADGSKAQKDQKLIDRAEDLTSEPQSEEHHKEHASECRGVLQHTFAKCGRGHEKQSGDCEEKQQG